jgi:hypothetical protein
MVLLRDRNEIPQQAGFDFAHRWSPSDELAIRL